MHTRPQLWICPLLALGVAAIASPLTAQYRTPGTPGSMLACETQEIVGWDVSDTGALSSAGRRDRTDEVARFTIEYTGIADPGPAGGVVTLPTIQSPVIAAGRPLSRVTEAPSGALSENPTWGEVGWQAVNVEHVLTAPRSPIGTYSNSRSQIRFEAAVGAEGVFTFLWVDDRIASQSLIRGQCRVVEEW